MLNVIIVSKFLRTPKKFSLGDPKVAGAAAGYPARTLVVKVAPTFSISPESVVGKPLSEVVRESLRATAQSVKDPDLRAQLLKLASLP